MAPFSFRSIHKSLVTAFAMVFLAIQLNATISFAQEKTEPKLQQEANQEPSKTELQAGSLKLKDFRPRPMLKSKSTDLQKAKFPAIDVHTHFGFKIRGSEEELQAFVETMDRQNIALCVSLDAKLTDMERHQDFLWTKYKDRFAVFVHLDWIGSGEQEDPSTWDCHQHGFAREVAIKLRAAKESGISGVKFFKRFGLGYKNPDGSLIQIDDRRWDPIWVACGELELPVIIHTADPAAFFLPIDEHNERYEELARHPDWSFFGDEFPSRAELLDARNHVIERFPDTKFIGAHVANNPEDLAEVAKWLDKYPNLMIEISSRIAELGRQPFSSREFFIEYQDRILFGTDGPWPELRLTYYWRFLETFDENFPYSEKEFPPQGLWRIHGLGLPDEVLKKIYYQNAIRFMPALGQKYKRAVDELENR